MTRARDIADLGQDKTTLASYVDTGVTSTDLERIDITTEGTSENSKVVTANSSGHVTLAGELRGPATFVVDPAAVGDNTGLLQVKGNLQVDGTTTTINSTTLTVDDKNIVLGSGAADSAAADGAGLTIDGASATMLYTHSTTSFDFNKPINVTGGGTFSGNVVIPDGGTIGSASDADAITIASTGKINTTSTNAGTAFEIENTNASTNYGLFIKGGTSSSNAHYALGINNSADSAIFRVMGNGNVGIGTTDVQTNLDITIPRTTTFGDSTKGVVLNSGGYTGDQVQLHFGYKQSGASNKYPVTIGTETTNQGAGTYADFFIATRATNGHTDVPTKRFLVSSDGNVGIGTNDPSSYDSAQDNLVIAGTGNEGMSIISGTNSNSTIAFGDGTGSAGYQGMIAYLNGTGGDAMTFRTTAVERMRITSSGRLGIGTNNPTYRIDCETDVNGEWIGTFRHTGDHTGSNGIAVDIAANNNANNYIFLARHNDGNNTALVVRGDGKTGIGTASPQSLLNILPGNAVEGVRVSGSSNTLGLTLAYTDAGHTHSYIYNKYSGNDNSDIIFGFGSSYGSGDVMTLRKSGNVGIGTSAPDSLFHLEHPSSHTQLFMDTSATSKACWLKIKQNNVTNRGWLFGMEGGLASLYVYDYSDSSYACHVPTGGTGWSANSDERMKKDIASMEDRLDDLLNIQVRRFKWKKNDRDAHGFIAQELVNYAPEAVEVGNDELVTQEEAEESETRKEGDLKNPWSISKEALIPMMVKSIQELSAKVTALESA